MHKYLSRATSICQLKLTARRFFILSFFLSEVLLLSLLPGAQLWADESDTQGSKAAATQDVVLTAKLADREVSNEIFEWTIINSVTEEVLLPSDDMAEIAVSLTPGTFDVIVVSEKYAGEQTIEISAAGLHQFVIELAGSAQEFGIDAPASVPAGSLITISWIGPNLDNDYLFIVNPMAKDNLYYSRKRRALIASEGPSGELVAPAQPGVYEIRYFSLDNGTVAFRRPMEVTAAQVEMQYPHEVPAGSLIPVSWSGPGLPGDRIFVSTVDMDDNRYFTHEGGSHKVESGVSTSIIAPVETGEHEIRYYSGNNGSPLARFPIMITQAEVKIEAPRIAKAGTEFDVSWTGPGAKGDFLFVAKPELEVQKYYSRGAHKTIDGPNARFTTPMEPGNYEIRYFSKINASVLARRAFVVR
jgi:hypothetical protein